MSKGVKFRGATSLWTVQEVSAAVMQTVDDILHLRQSTGLADDQTEAVAITVHICC